MQMRRAGGSSSGAATAAGNPAMGGMNPMMMGMMGQARPLPLSLSPLMRTPGHPAEPWRPAWWMRAMTQGYTPRDSSTDRVARCLLRATGD